MSQRIDNTTHQHEQIARDAVKYVNDHIESLNRQGDISKGDYPEKLNILMAVQTKDGELRTRLRLQKNQLSDTYISTYADIIEKHKVGYSLEMAVVAYQFLLNKKITNLDMIDMKDGDHVFVVIGRNPSVKGYDENNLETWGEHAYVCDPIKNSVYPVSLFKANQRAEAASGVKQQYQFLRGTPIRLKIQPAENTNTLFSGNNNQASHSLAPPPNLPRAKL